MQTSLQIISSKSFEIVRYESALRGATVIMLTYKTRRNRIISTKLALTQGFGKNRKDILKQFT